MLKARNPRLKVEDSAVSQTNARADVAQSDVQVEMGAMPGGLPVKLDDKPPQRCRPVVLAPWVLAAVFFLTTVALLIAYAGSAASVVPTVSELGSNQQPRQTAEYYVSDVGAVEASASGEFGTLQFEINYFKNGKQFSVWHDLPYRAGDGLYHLVVEIPRYARHKMEAMTSKEYNPIMQDEQDGAPRYHDGALFWDYGFIPQTWEDPDVPGGGDEVFNSKGDNDPVDVVVIGGDGALEMGSIHKVKVLGALAMIDSGELDWKVLVAADTDKHFNQMHDVGDIDVYYPGTVSGVREWLRWYKTPSGRPTSIFGWGEQALGKKHTQDIIEKTHQMWRNLTDGKSDRGGLWVPRRSAL